MKKSMSVPLLFAVPFMKEPLGWMLSKRLPAQSRMMGSSTVCTPRTGEYAPASTASRLRIRCKYSSAVIRGNPSRRWCEESGRLIYPDRICPDVFVSLDWAKRVQRLANHHRKTGGHGQEQV